MKQPQISVLSADDLNVEANNLITLIRDIKLFPLIRDIKLVPLIRDINMA